MKKFTFLFFFVVLTCGGVSAQIYYHNTMYAFTPSLYNPAAVGTGSLALPGVSGFQLDVFSRLQWAGFGDGAPVLGGVNMQGQLPKYSSGIGGSVVFDQIGPIQATRINVAYAYYMELGDKGMTLNFGANLGVMTHNINTSKFSPDDPTDPTLANVTNSLLPTLGAGIYLKGPDNKYFVGFSGQDLLEPSLKTLDGSKNTQIPRSFFLMGGYRFDNLFGNERMSLMPTAFIRTENFNFPPQVDLSLLWNYNPIFLGVSWRGLGLSQTNDAISGILGVQLSSRSFLAYSYDYTLSGFNAQNDLSTHELILTFMFPGKNGVRDKDFNVKDRPTPGLD